MQTTLTDDPQNAAQGALPSPAAFDPTAKPKPITPPTGAAPGASATSATSTAAPNIMAAGTITTPPTFSNPSASAAAPAAATSPATPSAAPTSPQLPATRPGMAPGDPRTPPPEWFAARAAQEAAHPGSTDQTIQPPSALPNPGGIVPTTPIDPNNDLRSSAVLPTSTPQLDAARTGLVNTTGAVTGYDRNADVASTRDALSQFFGPTDVQAGGAVGTAPSARLSSYNDLVDKSAGNLAGVDRVQMAKDLLAQFDTQQLPEHELALRQLTNKYVAQGGGKSGMVRTAYGNEDLTRQRDRDAMKSKLISAALEGSIQDQFNKTNTLAGLQGATSAQDAATRGEARTERGYATDVATGNVDRRLSAKAAAQSGASAQADANRAAKTGAVGASQNLFDTLNQEGQATRAETRGERAYQGAQEDKSYGRGITQLELEQQQKAQETARQLALLNAGESGNPAGTLTSLANGAGGLDPALIASLGASLGKQANQTPNPLDAILARMQVPGQVPSSVMPTVPTVPGNDPAFEY